MIPAILTGRKGSKGFPGKNLYKVLGFPLAYYPMKAALNCPEIDEVYMSTDDEHLMSLAYSYNVKVINRPKSLCTESALSSDVFLHAYNVIKKCNSIELVVLFMCNSPSITNAMISNGIKLLRERPELDSAVTVSKYNMYNPTRARKINEKGLLEPYVKFPEYTASTSDRDSVQDAWFADMGVSIVRPACLENLKEGLPPQPWMGRNIYPLIQDAGLDVDYEWQLGQVEYWLQRNHND